MEAAARAEGCRSLWAITTNDNLEVIRSLPTGAAAGISLATAERFVAEGCRVAAWDVNEAPVSAGVFQKVDVSDAGQVEAAVAEVVVDDASSHSSASTCAALRRSLE